MFPPDVEMMKKYTKQIPEQDEGVKAEHQIMRQYSRQQSNPAAIPPASKKEKDKEAEEEVNKICFQCLIIVYLL